MNKVTLNGVADFLRERGLRITRKIEGNVKTYSVFTFGQPKTAKQFTDLQVIVETYASAQQQSPPERKPRDEEERPAARKLRPMPEAPLPRNFNRAIGYVTVYQKRAGWPKSPFEAEFMGELGASRCAVRINGEIVFLARGVCSTAVRDYPEKAA